MTFEDDRTIWGTGPTAPDITGSQARRAAIRTADYVAAQHPHPADDTMPHLAGRELAIDLLIHTGLRELLDALGLNKGAIG